VKLLFIGDIVGEPGRRAVSVRGRHNEARKPDYGMMAR